MLWDWRRNNNIIPCVDQIDRRVDPSRIEPDDVVEWCKFGETTADLPQNQLQPHVEWLGDHADIPIANVALDAEASPEVIEAVVAAQ